MLLEYLRLVLKELVWTLLMRYKKVRWNVKELVIFHAKWVLWYNGKMFLCSRCGNSFGFICLKTGTSRFQPSRKSQALYLSHYHAMWHMVLLFFHLTQSNKILMLMCMWTYSLTFLNCESSRNCSSDLRSGLCGNSNISVMATEACWQKVSVLMMPTGINEFHWIYLAECTCRLKHRPVLHQRGKNENVFQFIHGGCFQR